MAANLYPQRPGHSPAAERGQLAGGGFDRFAVLADERVPDALAQRYDVLLLLGLGFGGDGVQCVDPGRRQRRDLAVGRPAEGRNDVSQVHDLPVKDRQHGRDHQESQQDGNPVFGTPPARRLGLGSHVTQGGGMGCGTGGRWILHGTLLSVSNWLYEAGRRGRVADAALTTACEAMRRIRSGE